MLALLLSAFLSRILVNRNDKRVKEMIYEKQVFEPMIFTYFLIQCSVFRNINNLLDSHKDLMYPMYPFYVPIPTYVG